jgi:hypothetical protein
MGYIYLPDILVSYSANLLDVGGALRDVLDRVSGQDQLILLCRRDLDINTLLHDNSSHDLLADEVSVDAVSTTPSKQGLLQQPILEQHT